MNSFFQYVYWRLGFKVIIGEHWLIVSSIVVMGKLSLEVVTKERQQVLDQGREIVTNLGCIANSPQLLSSCLRTCIHLLEYSIPPPPLCSCIPSLKIRMQLSQERKELSEKWGVGGQDWQCKVWPLAFRGNGEFWISWGNFWIWRAQFFDFLTSFLDFTTTVYGFF